MSFLDVIFTRRSIIRYENKEVSKDDLDKKIEECRQSPSAINKQPKRFVVVTNSELKEMKGIFSSFFEKAPVVFVGCTNIKSHLTGK